MYMIRVTFSGVLDWSQLCSLKCVKLVLIRVEKNPERLPVVKC
jgi:hypothetical protein